MIKGQNDTAMRGKADKGEQKERFFSIVSGYIRGNWLSVMIYLVFIIIFAVIFFLYQIEPEAVIYAAALCLLLLFIILPFRFIHYYFRHKELRELSGKKYLSPDRIPEGANLLEEDYRRLLLEWIDNVAKKESALRIFKEESIEYYSTWAHQIKTPIAVMRLLLQEEDTQENQKLLIELSRIEEYVDMVLSYFRLDSSEKDLVIREYSLDEIIRSCIRKYASWFVMKGISVQYAGTDLKLLTDEKWLSFMLGQLLSNAIKYTDVGTITIAVEEGPIVHIQDTGIGIAEEDQPRIFEKGFTGYNGRADKKSTGIGLYLVKRTAELLGTPVSVVSTPGAGSTFSIDLRKKYIEVE